MVEHQAAVPRAKGAVLRGAVEAKRVALRVNSVALSGAVQSHAGGAETKQRCLGQGLALRPRECG